jgi:hypothetical protein
MAVLTINGQVMPTPSTMTWDIQTFDLDSGRGINGEMQRQVICQKEKLNLTWRAGALTMAEVSMLLNAVMQPFFSVTYFSPLSNSMVTKTMYVGDRSTNFYSIIDGKPVIDNISFNLVER